ncbi:MAG: hypothetical protein AAF138_04100 [Planctomycetota bacterium]
MIYTMTRTRTRIALTLALGVAATVSTGCLYSGPKSTEGDANKIRYNLSPELYSTNKRPADVRNALAYQSNTNIRMLRADAGRFFMLDRPSRLTPEPVPY